MRVEIVPLLTDNYGYLVICERSGVAAIVDPAEAAPVLESTRRLGVELVAIWNTHHHWDHTAGNQALLAGGARALYAHASDRDRISGLTHALAHDDRFTLGALQVRVLHTPGHTRGGLVYLVDDAAFSGDALFGAGCGRIFEGDPAMMYSSLNDRIAALPPRTRIFCGHEYTQKNLSFACTVDPQNTALRQRQARVEALRAADEPSVPATLQEELDTNPFLRCTAPGIRRALEERFEHDDLSNPVQVFTRLRQLRDGF